MGTPVLSAAVIAVVGNSSTERLAGDALYAWVYVVVYVGFAVQSLGIATLFGAQVVRAWPWLFARWSARISPILVGGASAGALAGFGFLLLASGVERVWFGPAVSADAERGSWVVTGLLCLAGARRRLLAEHFEPLHARLGQLEDSALASNLAEPVSALTTTGWPRVDEEIRELRRSFRSASAPQDYRAIGTHCVGVLEALSAAVYDPARHLRPGETEPPVDKTNLRIGRFLEDVVGGAENEAVRAVAVKAAALAHSVKHRDAPTRRDTGIAADAVILLSNILRRIAHD